MQRHLPVVTLAIACMTGSGLADEITQVRAPELVWESTPEGVAFAALQGDRFREAYQAMVRLPAGITSPLHVKSANMFGVVIQGEMVHYAEGENPEQAKPIGPGAFYNIPRGLAHVSACVSATPCIAYLYQDGAFDFRPVMP